MQQDLRKERSKKCSILKLVQCYFSVPSVHKLCILIPKGRAIICESAMIELGSYDFEILLKKNFISCRND